MAIKPQQCRIVSLLPSATEIVCGLGLEAQLVGNSHECNWPPGIEHLPRVTRSNVDSSASSGDIDAQVRSLLEAGRPLYEVDSELLSELQPDLIITQAQCDVCAVSYDAVLEVVGSSTTLANVPVIALNPTSLGEVLDDICRIGEACQSSAAARKYRARSQQRIDVVVAKRAAQARRPRTLLIEWTNPLMIAGNWTPELVDLAGGEYGLAEPSKHSPCVEWSQIVTFAPELLIVAPCGFDRERSELELESLASLPGWQQLPAVVTGHVFALDGDALFNRPGPRLVDSVELLAELADSATNGLKT